MKRDKKSREQTIKKYGINCILLISLIVAGLIFCELFARFFIPVRNVGPTFSEYESYYGKRLKKSFSCIRITSEFTMRFNTNSLGFRGPELSTYPCSTILFLGDSFTMGYGVNDGEEYPALIRSAFEEKYGKGIICLINASMGNSGNGWCLSF